MSEREHPRGDAGTMGNGSDGCPSAGEVLSATWHLDGLLGQGGMATVYAATDVVGRRAAIKIMRASVMGTPGALKRFMREARFARRVTHRAMVRWLDDGTTDDGRPYMALDLLEGRTLEGLPRATRPSVRGVLDVMAEVLDLLADCHGQGIVHRDVKPANILVTREGAVKLLDFGLAHASDLSEDLVRRGTAVGTPSFMAPEQAMGAWDQVDARSDVFSVGATMYALLSGKALHQGRTEAASFTLAATRSAPSVTEVAPNLPASVGALVDRALRWDKRARFADAQEMRVALERVLSEFDPAEDEPLFHPRCAPVPLDTSPLELEHATSACRAGAEVLAAFDSAMGAALDDGDAARARAILGEAAEAFSAALASAPSGVTWTILPWCVRDRGTTVWRPTGLGLPLLQAMFGDGVRWIEVASHTPRDRLHSLLRAWFERALAQRPRSTNTVWDLWPLQGEGLTLGIATGTLAGSESEGAEPRGGLRAAMRLLEAAGGVSERPPRHDVLRPEEVQTILLGANGLEQLRGGAHGAGARWAGGFCACIAASLAVTDPDAPGNPGAWLSGIADDLLHAARPDLLLGAAKHLCDEAQGTRGLPLLVPPEIIGRLLLAVESHTRRNADDGTSAMLRDVLSVLGGTHAAGVVEVLEEMTDATLLLVATDFAEKHAARAADAIRASLPRLRGGSGYRMTRVLACDADDASHDALLALARDESSPLRVVARAALQGDVDRDEDLRLMLGAPGWMAREVALRTVKDYGAKSLTPLLRERAGAPEFHGLGLQERALTLEAIVTLERREGLAALEGLVRGHGVLGDEAWAETRVLAASMLAEVGDGGSVGALRAAEAPLWWNPARVRAAARKARAAIEGRAPSGGAS